MVSPCLFKRGLTLYIRSFKFYLLGFCCVSVYMLFFRESVTIVCISSPPCIVNPVSNQISADALQSSIAIGQNSSHVIILDWTAFMGGKHLSENGRNYLAACLDMRARCVFTPYRNHAHKAHAVLFHYADINDRDLPAVRQPWQRYVFFSHESAPSTSLPQSISKGFFNWTMTMSSKSDIPWPYARMLPIPTSNKDLLPSSAQIDENQFRQKTKWVAWLVSNCNANSKRERYVTELQKHISVDIFGACGNLTCPHGETCRKRVETEYKFYLAFENSICNDYITEKFWWFAKNKNIVLVVLSRKIMESAGILNNSYIAVDDFASPAELAKHLRRIGSNYTLYTKFFEWRRTHQVLLDDEDPKVGICKLCQRLLSDDPEMTSPKSTILEDEPLSWYRNVSNCDNDMLLRLIPK